MVLREAKPFAEAIEPYSIVKEEQLEIIMERAPLHVHV